MPEPIEKVISDDGAATEALEFLVSRGCDRGELLQWLDPLRPSGFKSPTWKDRTGKTLKTAKGFPARIRRLEREIRTWNNAVQPETWLRNLCHEQNPIDRIMLAGAFRTYLPELLLAYADYAELTVAQGTKLDIHSSKHSKQSEKFMIAEFIEYVTEATGTGHYEKIADLLAPLGIPVTADELRQYRRRYNHRV